MKTKSCERFIEEIAADAAGATPLRAEAAAHVGTCPTCQQKVAELRAVAAIQHAAAARLPAPGRPLSRRQLERALDNGAEQLRSFGTGTQPIFAGAMAIFALAAVLIISRKPQRPIETDLIAHHERIETRVEAEAFEPTMLALRNQIQGGGEQMLGTARTAAGLRHYRVRDVESELRN